MEKVIIKPTQMACFTLPNGTTINIVQDLQKEQLMIVKSNGSKLPGIRIELVGENSIKIR